MGMPSEEFDFFVFLLIQYANHKKIPADIVLKTWDQSGISDMICKMYWRYHTEALENAFDDIDQLCNERR